MDYVKSKNIFSFPHSSPVDVKKKIDTLEEESGWDDIQDYPRQGTGRIFLPVVDGQKNLHPGLWPP